MRFVPLTSALFLTFAAASHADVVVYRCTDASGAVSLQGTPCVTADRQERRTLPTPLPATPARAQPRTTPAAPEPITTTASPAPARRTPAPLYLCERYDGETVESTSGIPERRWVPLWALDADPRAPRTGLDSDSIGRTSPLRRTARDGVPALQVSALTLGTWVEDVCTPLSAAQICARRRATLGDYGRSIFNAGQSEADRLRAEEASLRTQVAEECG